MHKHENLTAVGWLFLRGGLRLTISLAFREGALERIELLDARLKHEHRREIPAGQDFVKIISFHPQTNLPRKKQEALALDTLKCIMAQLQGRLDAKRAKMLNPIVFKVRSKAIRIFLSRKASKLAEQVYLKLLTIPSGSTTTYLELANLCRTSPRAIGQALAKNPYPILIPCHRVVGTDGSLVGYSSAGGVKTKALLLKYEMNRRQGRLDCGKCAN